MIITINGKSYEVNSETDIIDLMIWFGFLEETGLIELENENVGTTR